MPIGVKNRSYLFKLNTWALLEMLGPLPAFRPAPYVARLVLDYRSYGSFIREKIVSWLFFILFMSYYILLAPMYIVHELYDFHMTLYELDNIINTISCILSIIISFQFFCQISCFLLMLCLLLHILLYSSLFSNEWC